MLIWLKNQRMVRYRTFQLRCLLLDELAPGLRGVAGPELLALPERRRLDLPRELRVGAEALELGLGPRELRRDDRDRGLLVPLRLFFDPGPGRRELRAELGRALRLRTEVNNSLIIVNFFHKIQNKTEFSANF